MGTQELNGGKNMSLFTFIASDHLLPEINLSGLIKMKVKDVKKLNPLPSSAVPLDELDEDLEVLYAKSESDTGGLQISICNNPPYGINQYITKKHIYWLEGSFDSRCLNQLSNYIRTNIQREDRVELWSIWFGDKIENKIYKTVPIDKLTPSDLEILRQHECCCILLD